MAELCRIETVGFDADDTLWHNERVFRMTQDRFADLLRDHAEAPDLTERLEAAERRNLARYGFGVKGFVLSMIETAVEVTDDRVPGDVVRRLIEFGHEMLEHPIELLPEAQEAVCALAGRYRLLLITKGDLLDQERKLAQSGLGDMFDGVEIVSDKTPSVYRAIFDRHGVPPAAAAMVGNSVRSDVAPPIAAGGWGIFVPHELTWSYEAEAPPLDHPRFRQIEGLGELPKLLDGLAPNIW